LLAEIRVQSHYLGPCPQTKRMPGRHGARQAQRQEQQTLPPSTRHAGRAHGQSNLGKKNSPDNKRSHNQAVRTMLLPFNLLLTASPPPPSAPAPMFLCQRVLHRHTISLGNTFAEALAHINRLATSTEKPAESTAKLTKPQAAKTATTPVQSLRCNHRT
jgi:hypothetical protein